VIICYPYKLLFSHQPFLSSYFEIRKKGENGNNKKRITRNKESVEKKRTEKEKERKQEDRKKIDSSL